MKRFAVRGTLAAQNFAQAETLGKQFAERSTMLSFPKKNLMNQSVDLEADEIFNNSMNETMPASLGVD